MFSKSTFGGTSSFTNPSTTGLFGAPSNTNPPFGQSAASTSNTGGLFSASPRPGGLMFGSPASTGSSLFGASSTGPTTGATGGGLFGTNTGILGGSNVGRTQMSIVNPSTSGTAMPKFQPTAGTDVIRRGGVNSNVMTKLHCITAMKEYANKSVHELRLEDYKANRKRPTQPMTGGGLFGSTGTTTGFGAGQTTGFGSTVSSTAGTLFGTPAASTATSGGLFGGASAFSTTKSIFGGTATPTISSGGLFGSNPAVSGSTSTGFFGFGNNPSSTTTTGGIFGGASKSTPQFGSGLGTTSVFGQPAAATGGLFGATTATTQAGVKSMFGTTTPSTGGLFGTQPSGGLFGSNPAPAASTGFTGFGTATSTSGTNIFGGTSTSAPGGLFGGASTGLFGGSTAQAPKFGLTGGGGLFGSTGTSAPQSTGFFSSGTTTQTGTGLFGTTSGTLGAAPTGFGTVPTASAPNTGFAFGGAVGTQSNTMNTGLFGGGSTLGVPNQPAAPIPSQIGLSANPWEALAQQAQLQQQILSLVANSPYGQHSLFRDFGTTSKNEELAVENADGGNLTSSMTKGVNLFSVGNQAARQQQLSKSLRPSMLTTRTKQPRLLPAPKKQLFSGYDDEENESFTTRKKDINNGRMNFSVFSESLAPQQGQNPSPFFVSRNDWKRLNTSQLRRPSMSDKSSVQHSTNQSNLTDSKHWNPCASKSDFMKTLDAHPMPTGLKKPTFVEDRREMAEASKVLKSMSSTLLEEFVPASTTNMSHFGQLASPVGASSPIVVDVPVSRVNVSSAAPETPSETHHVNNANTSSIILPADVTFTVHPSHSVSSAISKSKKTVPDKHLSVQQAPADSTSVTPYGIRLTKPQYYIIPSLEELIEREADEISRNVGMNRQKPTQCWVDDFVIGRRGFGHILFPGRTNIANLNLDEIVHIAQREVTVYPEDDTADGCDKQTHPKPPLGQGLNKQARITLEQVWPTHRATREPIKDPQRLAEMHFVEKLERATDRLDAKFLSYEPQQGAWKFEVHHFSKYGFLESDDEDSDVPPENMLKKKLESNGLLKGMPHEKASKQAVDSLTTQISVIKKNGFSGNKDDNLETMEEECDKMENIPRGKTYGISLDDFEVESNASSTSYLPQSQKLELDTESILQMNPYEMHSNDTLIQDYQISQSTLQRQKASLFLDDEEEGDVSSVFRKPCRVQSKRKNQVILGDISDLNSFAPVPFKRQTPLVSPVRKVVSVTKSDLMDLSLFKSIREKLHAPPVSRSGLITQGGSAPLSRVFSIPQTNQASVQLSLMNSHIATHPMDCGRDISKEMSTLQQKLLSISSSASCVPFDIEMFFWHKQPAVWSYYVPHSNDFELSKSAILGLLLPRLAVDNIRTPALAAVADHTRDRESSISLFEITPSQIVPESTSLCMTVLKTFQDPNKELLHASLKSSSTTNDSQVAPHWCSVTGEIGLQTMRGVKQQSQPTSRMFHLCHALWGKESEIQYDKMGHEIGSLSALLRCQMLSEWLKEQLSMEYEKNKSNLKDGAGCEDLFFLITGGQIQQACDLALTGYNRPLLASLISQFVNISGSPLVKQMIRSQLLHWHDYEIDVLVEKWEMSMYVILAGYPQWQLSNGKLCQPLATLSWLRSFACFYWFMQSDLTKPESAISNAFESYTCAFQDEIALYPNPPELDATSAPGSDGSCFDYAYHLIHLFCDRSFSLEKVLEPACQSTKVEHLYGLAWENSWYLFQILEAIGYSHLHETRKNLLHMNFAHELEQCGALEWAVFVLLHLPVHCARVYHVKKLLARHVSLHQPMDMSEAMEVGDDVAHCLDLLPWETFIVDYLYVPVAWIYEAKALLAHYEKLPLIEIHYQLAAKNYLRACEIAVQQLPSLFVHHRFLEAFQLCQKVLISEEETQSVGRSDSFVQYQERIQLFRDFYLLRLHVVNILKHLNLLDSGIISPTTWRELLRGLSVEKDIKLLNNEDGASAVVYLQIDTLKDMVSDMEQRFPLFSVTNLIERECKCLVVSYCSRVKLALDKCNTSLLIHAA